MTAEQTILTVDDEPPVRELLRFVLESAGFRVIEAGNARETFVAVAEHDPDLILLDWMLPEVSGVDIARRLRREPESRDIPIIMLTARGEEDARVRGLEVGADDFVVKPFSTRELLARVNAVLRRAGPAAHDGQLEIGGVRLDQAAHRVFVGAEELSLGPTEFRLLRFFLSHPERVFSRAQLLDRVWGRGVYVEERTVDVHIRRLRKALGPQGKDALIQTVRGAGYRFSGRG